MSTRLICCVERLEVRVAARDDIFDGPVRVVGKADDVLQDFRFGKAARLRVNARFVHAR